MGQMIAMAAFVVFYGIYFWPVLHTGKLLAPGDGINSYYSAVAHPWSIWTDLIFGGYPSFADPQFLTWYPLRWFGSHYNALVVSAYVIASFTAFGYARVLTGSVIAAIIAGLVYGGSGFMMAHLGHLTIIHSTAWIPLALWGLELLARECRWKRAAPVAGGVALSYLGGHPQPWAYGMYVIGAYAVWRAVTLNGNMAKLAWPYLLRAFGGIGIGLLIICVQLIPLAQLVKHTVRGAWTIADFTSYSLPVSQLPMLIFPNLFGNANAFYRYFGELSITELAFYAGVVPMLLAWLACWQSQLRKIVAFWVVVGLLAMVFMLGSATPMGWLGFHVPVVDDFRGPGRAGMVFDLAVAMLAAIGTAALQRKGITGRGAFWGLFLAAAGFAGMLAAVVVNYPAINHQAIVEKLAFPAMTRNPAVLIPVLWILAGFAACIGLVYANNKNRRWIQWCLILIVMLDMASFGRSCEWQIYTADAPKQAVGKPWQTIIQTSQRDFGRVFPLEGVKSDGPAVPNVNLVYDLASASGYGPLLLSRYADLAGVNTSGEFSVVPAADSALWQLLGVEWFLSRSGSWDVTMGDCGSGKPEKELRLTLPRAVDIQEVRIESYMGCSVGLLQNAPVLQVNIDNMVAPAATMRAGRDTAEWSWDKPDIRTKIKHELAPIASSFNSGGFQGHWYRATLKFNPPKLAAHTLLITSLLHGPAIKLRKVEITDTNGKELTLSLAGSNFSKTQSWKRDVSPPGFTLVEKNLDYLGRAWLVDTAIRLSDMQALETIKSGRIRGQGPFVPSATAIIDDAPPNPDYPRLPSERAGEVQTLTRVSPQHWKFQVRTKWPTLLLISQTYYPGWVARVNGLRTRVLRADYALQAIPVPAGVSEVDLRFLPKSLGRGGALSLVGVVLLLLCVIEPKFRKGKMST